MSLYVIIGSDGTILKRDNLANYTDLSTDAKYTWRCCAGMSPNEVYICGLDTTDDSVAYLYYDGNSVGTWSNAPDTDVIPSSWLIQDILCISTSSIYIAAIPYDTTSAGKVIHWDGSSWSTVISTSYSFRPYGLFFSGGLYVSGETTTGVSPFIIYYRPEINIITNITAGVNSSIYHIGGTVGGRKFLGTATKVADGHMVDWEEATISNFSMSAIYDGYINTMWGIDNAIWAGGRSDDGEATIANSTDGTYWSRFYPRENSRITAIYGLSATDVLAATVDGYTYLYEGTDFSLESDTHYFIPYDMVGWDVPPTIIMPPTIWKAPIKINVKNWVLNREGTQIRQGCSMWDLRPLLRASNHLSAFTPRIIFDQCCYDITNIPIDGYNSYYRWSYYDSTLNNKNYTIKGIGVYSDAYDAYAWLDGYDDTILSQSLMNSDGYSVVEITNVRTSSDGEIIRCALNTDNDTGNLGFAEICVQESPVEVLSSDYHTFTKESIVNASYISADTVESIRDVLQSVKESNLPVVFSWSALGASAPETQRSCQDGICITNDGYLNIFNLSDTTRTATSPGFFIDGYYSGKGQLSRHNKVYIEYGIYCRVDGGEASVKILGPDDGYCTTSVTNTDYDWIYSNNDELFYYSDRRASEDDITYQNKFDWLAKADTGYKLQILACVCWITNNTS